MYAPDADTARRAAAAAYARVDELGKSFSDYDNTSELVRLSNLTLDGPMAEPAPVSGDLWRVLRTSVDASERSGGAFDVTVGPFVRLWRRSRDLQQLPTSQRLERTRASVGHRHLRVDPDRPRVALLAPRMRLDLGGIATGYAVDDVLRVLRTFGITRALLDAGGDLAVGDPPPGRAGWRVAVQSLEAPGKPTGAYVELRNAGVSTSGDVYRFVELGGRRYSHIVDPATGLGLTERRGVTVIAPDDLTADWLSTAVSVLGREKGFTLVESIPGAAARLTTLEDGGIKVYESTRFGAYLADPEATVPGPSEKLE
jgi:thiamine biosynthesis lipoprotein